MIDEISLHPFARPLLFWIIGILLYTFFPVYALCYGIGVVFLILLLFLGIFAKEPSPKWLYRMYLDRWLWGVAWALLAISLSIAVSYYNDVRTDLGSAELSPVREKAMEIQATLVDRLDRLRLADEEKALVATLALGYRQSMNREIRRSFSLVGVSHVLAVSGFHVAVVCGILSFLCSYIPKRAIWCYLRYGLWMGTLWFFVFITGLSPSAVRAGLMVSFYLTHRLLDRREIDSYNTLAAAAFCMLAYNPFYLYDIGFQLSYLAVFSILFIGSQTKGRIVVWNPLLSVPFGWVKLTIAAQIGTGLLCLYYFQQFPLVSLFTNPPISFLVTLLLPLTYIWLCYPENLWGYEWLRMGVEEVVHGMIRVVETFAEFPYASLTAHLDLGDVLGGYGVLFLGMIYIAKRNFKVLLAALTLFLLLSLRILYFIIQG